MGAEQPMSGGMGHYVSFRVFATDPEGVFWVKMWFTDPDEILFQYPTFYMNGYINGETVEGVYLGDHPDFSKVGTYTYAYMEAEDRYGVSTGQINQDNPFNFPSITVLGAN